MLSALGLALGGKAGAQLGAKLGMPTSRMTILRVLRHMASPPEVTPRILGVDEWAYRRGKKYGTILVDLERSVPVDLLADQSATTFAAWLRSHPGVQVISRDRAGEYALGARQGAPEAIQVADRYHLIRNLADVGERILAHHRKALKQVRLVSGSASRVPSVVRYLRPDRERTKQHKRQARVERYEAVRQLYAGGMSMQQIARSLHLNRKTVAQWVKAETFPELLRTARRPSILIPYVPYLQARYLAGERNGVGLFREVVACGYPGSRMTVERFLQGLRALEQQGVPIRSVTPATVELTPRRAIGLMLRRREDLTEEETATLKQACQVHPQVQQTQMLLQEFVSMLRERRGVDLEQWIAMAFHCGIAEWRSFVRKLRQDQAAVQAGLTLKWNNGPVEGHINRLKLLKRSMYGRAGFALLRQRVLDHHRKCA
jgi:transposase